ncbi:hypothetical protein IFVP201_C2210264 [Vibrio parahaemolyticus]
MTILPEGCPFSWRDEWNSSLEPYGIVAIQMARAALDTASIPDAHSRLTVDPGTWVSSLASSKLIRAMLRLSSPAWFAHPKITSSERIDDNAPA